VVGGLPQPPHLRGPLGDQGISITLLVLAGRGNLADPVLPPIVFFVVNALIGFGAAFWAAPKGLPRQLLLRSEQ
jgi:hypothetical protein